MDALTAAAASGIRARIESLDMLANNLANASAAGFKSDSESYGLYVSAEAADSPEGTNPAILPVIQSRWTDFSQGALLPTSNSTDLALSGKGFFVASTSSGPSIQETETFDCRERANCRHWTATPFKEPTGILLYLTARRHLK
jgi:flagellar hook-basal body protein